MGLLQGVGLMLIVIGEFCCLLLRVKSLGVVNFVDLVISLLIDLIVIVQ